MSGAVPSPGRPLVARAIRPLRQGAPLWRVHDGARPATDFFTGVGRPPTRFAPIRDERSGMPVPVMYAALDPAGALFETIFHDVPERGPRSVQLARLQSRVLTRLDIHSAAILADLTKPGLATLGTTRAELIDSDGSHYSTTALWSAALYNDNPGLAGLWWISRPNDRFDSLMFFDGRIDASSFGAAPRSMPLWEGEGLDLVAKWAGQADITLI